MMKPKDILKIINEIDTALGVTHGIEFDQDELMYLNGFKMALKMILQVETHPQELSAFVEVIGKVKGILKRLDKYKKVNIGG